ncbi:MAG: pentapeptide repeat-containing protein [Trichodesmium sp.]
MNRRKREILQQYQQGERNFQRANLRGLSFKGKDLSDADFSKADIRGTNFSGANLTRAKFCGAKAGLQKRWVVVLLVGVFILAGISGFFSIFTGYIIRLIFDSFSFDSLVLESQISGWFYLILVIVFWIMVIYKGVLAGFVALTIILAIVLVGVLVVALAFTLSFVTGKALVLTGILVLTAVLAIVFALTAVLAIAFAFVIAGNKALALIVVFTLIFTVFGGLTVEGIKGTFNINFNISSITLTPDKVLGLTLAFILTLSEILLTAYITRQGIKGDKKLALLRNLTFAFAATGGTCFREADLTDADFTNATLKSTDFRGANITRTCWKNTIKLDHIRPGKTYLKDAKVRELVKTGQGENINLDRLNYLQGVNLQGANLTNASFIEANLNSANLQDANLSRAKLVGTFLDQTDLTGATLTGAFLEEWGITTTTKLEGIKCDYVYMRLPPEKRPDFLKLPPEESLDERLRRKPANEDKNFEEGEFAEFIKPLVNTLDLYHNQGVDPRIAAYSFEKLQKDHPEAEIKMRSMEVRGENNDKLLIRVDTTPEADYSVLDKEYFDTYNELKAISPEQLRAVLAQREKNIEWYKGVLSATVNRPSVNIRKSNQGDINMPESSGDKIYIKENYGVVGKEGKIHGAVGNKGGNYGVVGSQGDIKDSKIAGTIYESQEQNLAQAAKDIQELLEQLDETYPSDTTTGKMKIATEVITQIDNNSTKAERIFSAIKAGGVSAVEQLLNHPASSFVIAALEDWQKTK